MNDVVLVQAINSSSIDRLAAYVPDSFHIDWQLNADFQLSFTAWDDGSVAYTNLSVENTISFKNVDYVIKQANPDYSGPINTMNITATHIYNEVGRVFQHDVKKGDHDYTPDDILKFYLDDNKLGFSYKVTGKFDKQPFTDLGNSSGKDALSKILDAWTDAVIYPNGKEIQVYSHDEFFKDHGNRIDYLNSATEIGFEYDSTNIVNQVKAIGPTYEKTTKIVSGGIDGSSLTGTMSAVNGDWGPAIKYASQLTNAKATDTEVNLIKQVIQHESRGSETVVNDWDNNAKAGTPSKGLVQFIQPTFNNYAIKPFTNILKGFHQLIALFNDSNWRTDIGLNGWGPTGSRRMDKVVGAPSDSMTLTGSNGAIRVIADAKKYLGIPYVWGGHNKANPRAGMDCSGLVSQIYHDFGIEIPAYTVAMESYGTQVSTSNLQVGDMLMFGPHGATHHITMYIGGGLMIEEPQPGQVCHILRVSDEPPSFALRNAKMSAVVSNGQVTDVNKINPGSIDAKTDTNTTTENYFEPFMVQDDESIKKWGLHPGEDISSDTIKNAADMKKWVLTKLTPNPTLSTTVTTMDNEQFIPGDMIRLEIRPKEFITNMGVVEYDYYPFSKTNPTKLTLNQTIKTILDYERGRLRATQSAQKAIKKDVTDTSSGRETWNDAEVSQFESSV